jgi:hypothetical protein
MSSDVKDLRSTQRFVTTEPLTGSFGTAAIAIVDIGETGAQVEHSQPLRLATRGRLTFRRGSDTFAGYGLVVWSHLSRMPNERGKLLYRSGIRFEDDAADFSGLIDTLLQRQIIRIDAGSLARKKERIAEREAARSGRQLVRDLPQMDVSADQVLLIQHARDRLRTHPDEALKWYNRAKYSIAQSVAGTPDMLYHREEVLAVWEYLERTVELQTIARVFDMKKVADTPLETE